jgi:hypothetical protein
MQQHPTFDLWLHTTQELSALLAEPVTERVTLHEWTLSCVQRITLADGQRLIYKAQASEGVEADFYAQVESPLLPQHRALGRCKDTVAILFEYIAAPPLKDLRASEAEIVAHGRALVEAVQALPDNAPLYATLDGPTRWQGFVDETLAKLSALIASGKFRGIRPEMVTRLASWASSAPVCAAFRGRSVLTHADLSGGNVFLTPSGYKIIDWQFPRRLPQGFDLAVYLDFMGVDPYAYVDAAVIHIAWFVRVAWYVHTQADLFPQSNRYEVFVDENVRRVLARENPIGG